MKKHRKIPIIKNRGLVVKEKNKRKAGLKTFVWVILLFGLMLLYVWLKVETNLALKEIERLEIQQTRLAAENRKLRSKEIELSDFSRIQKIATKDLNLQFAASENVIEVEKK